MKKIIFILIIVSFFCSCEKEHENFPDPYSSESKTESNISKYHKLEVSPTKIQLTTSSGKATIKITSDTEWTVQINNSTDPVNGLKVYPLSGNGNQTVTIEYGAIQTQFYSQNAVIIFKYISLGSDEVKTVTIYRSKYY